MNKIVSMLILSLQMSMAHGDDANVLPSTDGQKDIPYLTVHGQVDPRIHVEILSWFRSTELTRTNCHEIHPGTGSTRSALTVRGETELTGNFTVKIPLQITGKDNCGWKYRTTELQIMRAGEDRNVSYSRYWLLSSDEGALHVEMGSNGGSSNSRDIPTSARTNKKHYFLGPQIDLTCQTRYYEIVDSVEFKCLPQKDIDWQGGVDSLDDLTVHLTAKVDESQFAYIEYVAPPKITNWTDWVAHVVLGLFRKGDE